MAIRAFLLSGIGAFGLGLLAVGGLFHEPGGRAAHPRLPVQPSAPALKWELWQLPALPAPTLTTELEPDLVAAPDPDRVPDLASDTDDTNTSGVWDTPEVWSSEE